MVQPSLRASECKFKKKQVDKKNKGKRGILTSQQQHLQEQVQIADILNLDEPKPAWQDNDDQEL